MDTPRERPDATPRVRKEPELGRPPEPDRTGLDPSGPDPTGPGPVTEREREAERAPPNDPIYDQSRVQSASDRSTACSTAGSATMIDSSSTRMGSPSLGRSSSEELVRQVLVVQVSPTSGIVVPTACRCPFLNGVIHTCCQARGIARCSTK